MMNNSIYTLNMKIYIKILLNAFKKKFIKGIKSIKKGIKIIKIKK